jgi:hypothetical protein
MSQPTQNYTLVSDAEAPEAIAALAKIIGEVESAKMSWVRRLVRLGTGELGLTVNSCVAIRRDSLDWQFPWNVPNGLMPITVAFPLGEAVSILQQPDCSEVELERRRQAFASFQSEKSKREAEKLKAEKEAEARLVKDREDETRFREREWQMGFTPLGRFASALALMVEKRDPDLANDLRILVDCGERSTGGSDPTRPIPYPRTCWWQSPKVQTFSHRWWENASTQKAST